MLPLLGGLLGAAGSVAGGIMGAQAAEDTNRTNWKINLLNYYQRENERAERIAEARRAEKDQKLGFQDANGNSMKFVPGKGWVAEQGLQDKQLSDMQRAEQMRVMQVDLPMKRRAMERQEKSALEDAITADTFRREMKSLQKGEDASLEGDLYAKATSGAKEAHDDALSNATLQAMRTDSSNIGKIFEANDKARAKSYADAKVDAALKSRGVASAEYDKRLSGLSQLYNMFASRANQQPAVAFTPTKIESLGEGKDFNAAQKIAASLGNALSDAAGAKGGTIDYQQPNYGWANAVGGGGNALAAAFKSMGAKSDYESRLRNNTEA